MQLTTWERLIQSASTPHLMFNPFAGLATEYPEFINYGSEEFYAGYFDRFYSQSTVYADPARVSSMINDTYLVNRDKYRRLWDAITAEYTPLDEYSRTEVETHDGEDTGTKTGTETDAHTGTDTDAVITDHVEGKTNVTTFDSDTEHPLSSTESDANSNRTYTHGETITTTHNTTNKTEYGHEITRTVTGRGKSGAALVEEAARAARLSIQREIIADIVDAVFIPVYLDDSYFTEE